MLDQRRAGVVAILLAVLLALLVPVEPAGADDPAGPFAPAVAAAPERFEPSSRSARYVIEDAAERHDVAAAPLVALAVCESRLDPGATGDYGRSHGLMQLNDLPGTGLYWHFLAVGYTDAYDAEQAADYVARVAAGEWRREGVTLARWSCWWRR